MTQAQIIAAVERMRAANAKLREPLTADAICKTLPGLAELDHLAPGLIALIAKAGTGDDAAYRKLLAITDSIGKTAPSTMRQ